jgi:hypothetical protein
MDVRVRRSRFALDQKPIKPAAPTHSGQPNPSRERRACNRASLFNDAGAIASPEEATAAGFPYLPPPADTRAHLGDKGVLKTPPVSSL